MLVLRVGCFYCLILLDVLFNCHGKIVYCNFILLYLNHLFLIGFVNHMVNYVMMLQYLRFFGFLLIINLIMWRLLSFFMQVLKFIEFC